MASTHFLAQDLVHPAPPSTDFKPLRLLVQVQESLSRCRPKDVLVPVQVVVHHVDLTWPGLWSPYILGPGAELAEAVQGQRGLGNQARKL